MLAGRRSILLFDPVALEMNFKGRWGNQSAASTKREVRGGLVPLSSKRFYGEKKQKQKQKSNQAAF